MAVLDAPFKFTELEAYCRLYNIEDPDDREEFVECMARMSVAMRTERHTVEKEKLEQEKQLYEQAKTDTQPQRRLGP